MYESRDLGWNRSVFRRLSFEYHSMAWQLKAWESIYLVLYQYFVKFELFGCFCILYLHIWLRSTTICTIILVPKNDFENSSRLVIENQSFFMNLPITKNLLYPIPHSMKLLPLYFHGGISSSLSLSWSFSHSFSSCMYV